VITPVLVKILEDARLGRSVKMLITISSLMCSPEEGVVDLLAAAPSKSFLGRFAPKLYLRSARGGPWSISVFIRTGPCKKDSASTVAEAKASIFGQETKYERSQQNI